MTTIKTFAVLLIILLAYEVTSQCNNSGQFPTTTEQAPYYQRTVEVGTFMYAGEHTLVTGWNAFQTYIFTANPTDYISIYTSVDELVAHGPSPLTFETNDIYFGDSLKINVNLISPPCGTQNLQRYPTLECVTCLPAANVAIGNESPHPSAVLDLSNTRGQGLLLPSFLATPTAPAAADGLLFYNRSTDKLRIHSDGSWENIATTTDITESYQTQQQISIGSTAFSPWTSTAEYGHSISRGKYSDGLALYAPINIPSGYIIEQVTYYYYDNSSSNNADIRLHYAGATSSSTTSVCIANTSGASQTIRTASFNNLSIQVLPNTNYYISFNPDNISLDSSIAIKSVTIKYRPQ